MDMVGVPEIAQLLGVSRQRVYQLVDSYDDFPAPLAKLAVGRIWSREAVEDWNRRHDDRPTGRHRTLPRP
jgi:predicted DNA-binding transcriptional regulator AlpA